MRRSLFVLVLGLVFMPIGGWADNSTDFEIQDDVTVLGEEGTLNDADAEFEGEVAVQRDIYQHAGQFAGPFAGFGRIENLLTYSQEFDNSAWTTTGATVAANQSAPDQSNTAYQLTNSGGSGGSVSQSVAGSGSIDYVFSVWLKAGTSNSAEIEISDNGSTPASNSETISLSDKWKRYEVSFTSASDANSITVKVVNNGADGKSIYIWGAQLEQAEHSGVYIKTGANPVSERFGLGVNGQAYIEDDGWIGGDLTVGGSINASGEVGTKLTEGSVVFAGSGGVLSEDNNNLYWDDTNNRLGIGTRSPGAKLHAVGTGRTSIRVGGPSTSSGAVGDFAISSSDGAQVNGVTGWSASFRTDSYGAGQGSLTFYRDPSSVWAMGLKPNGDVVVNGNVGIGTTVPTEKLEVVGSIKSDNIRHYYLTRTLPTTAGEYVEIGNFNIEKSGHNLDIAITVTNGDFSVAKRYLIPVQYCYENCVTGQWYKAIPISSTGAYNGNDFELVIMQDNSNQRINLRLLRTAGTTAGTAIVQIHQRGSMNETLTESTATGTMSTPTSFWPTTVLTQTKGNVGIGTTDPSGYKLYVNGTAYSTGGWQSSDIRLKDVICSDLRDRVKDLFRLSPFEFKWKVKEYPGKGLPEGKHFGLSAQEVERYFPEVVREDNEGYKAISYEELIPLLLEAIKYQQEEIEGLREEVRRLKDEVKVK